MKERIIVGADGRKYITTEPQRQQRTYTLRKWQGLTDEERLALWSGIECDLECLKPAQYARAIEAKLKEKNT